MIFRWFRKTVRTYTSPIPIDVAAKKKENISFLYALLSMGAFGIVMYRTIKDNPEFTDAKECNKSLPTAMKWANTLNTVGHVKVYQIKGIQTVGQYEFDKIDKVDIVLPENNVDQAQPINQEKAI